jgi:hypothetical protein
VRTELAFGEGKLHLASVIDAADGELCHVDDSREGGGAVDVTARLARPGQRLPFDAFWGAPYAIVAAPDDNDVGLMSPIDEARRLWPPEESPSP